MHDTTTRHRRGLWTRRVLAVIAGLAVSTILAFGTDEILYATGTLPRGPLGDNTGLQLLEVAYRSLYSVVGSYVAARLAADHPMRHALALGALGTSVGLASIPVAWDLAPAWYTLAFIVLPLPLAWLGGRACELRSGRSQEIRPRATW